MYIQHSLSYAVWSFHLHWLILPTVMQENKSGCFFLFWTYEVNYNGQTSYVINYLYCRIWLERLLYDGERDLLVAAKFLVQYCQYDM